MLCRSECWVLTMDIIARVCLILSTLAICEWNGMDFIADIQLFMCMQILFCMQRKKRRTLCHARWAPQQPDRIFYVQVECDKTWKKTRPKQNKMKQKKIMGNWTEHNAYTRKPTHISYMDSIFMWADKIGSKIVQRCNDAPYRATRCSHCVHSHNMTVFKTSRLHNVRSKIKRRQKCGQFTWNNTKRVFAVAQ